MTATILVLLYIIVVFADAMRTIHETKSKFSGKLLLDRAILVHTKMILGLAILALRSTKFYTLTIEVKSAYEIADLETKKRV